MRNVSWEAVTVGLVSLLGAAIIGLVSVVWGQQSELSVQRERVDALKTSIVDMRESLEKKLDRIDEKLATHLEREK